MPATKIPAKGTTRDPRARAKALRRERYHQRKEEQRIQEAAAVAAEGDADLEAALDVPSQVQKGRKSPAAVSLARENLTRAFELMGGVPAFVKWGRKNPTEFYRIWARLVPKEAVEETNRQPLEDLLAQLATKSEKTVATAAYEIGQETLLAAREQVSIEDARAALSRSEEDTLQ